VVKKPSIGFDALWIQTAFHTGRTWSKERQIEPLSGEIQVRVLPPGAAYGIAWWDTYARGKNILSSQEVTGPARRVLSKSLFRP